MPVRLKRANSLRIPWVLLALTSRMPSPRIWPVTRVTGVLLVLTLALNIVAVFTWDINRWLGGGVWIFDPTRGVWPLFGGQWIGPLITNALILALALGLALLALIRSFLIRPENEQPEKQLGRQSIRRPLKGAGPGNNEETSWL